MKLEERKINAKNFERSFEESQSKFHALMNSSPEAVIIIDDEGCVISINSLAIQMFGYSKDDLVGEYIDILIPEGYRKEHKSDRELYIKKPTLDRWGLGWNCLRAGVMELNFQ